MKKTLVQSLAVALVLALAGVVATPSLAQEKAEKGKGEGKEKKAPSTIPFTGKITAVDKDAKSITLSGEKARVIHITAKTRLTKGEGNQPADFEDAKVGEQVGGGYREADGKKEATTVHFGARPPGKAKAKGKEKKKE